MARSFYRFGLLLIGLPAFCIFAFSFSFAAFAVQTVPQLPPWAQGPVLAWIAGEAGETYGELPPGSGFSGGIPPAGYDGEASFLCLLPPEIGYLTDPFGVLRSGGWVHKGIDYGTYQQEVPVRTPFGGLIVFAGWGGSYGNLVVIENAGYRVYLAHLSAFAVGGGAVVAAGQTIGVSGETGNASGIHVHFEVRIWDGAAWVAVDPNRVLLPGQGGYCDWYALAVAE